MYRLRSRGWNKLAGASTIAAGYAFPRGETVKVFRLINAAKKLTA